MAGVILTSRLGGSGRTCARLETRLREDISQLREDMKQLPDCVELGRTHSQAHLEGLLEGLREAITGRVKAS